MAEELNTIVPAPLIDLYTDIIATQERSIDNMERHLKWHDRQDQLLKQAIRLIKEYSATPAHREALKLALEFLHVGQTFNRLDSLSDKRELEGMRRSFEQHKRGEVDLRAFSYDRQFNPKELL